MCPDCRVLRTPRSRHCAICNRCCDRFDHHCPWINNCVGLNNNNSFVCFIYTLVIMLLLNVASAIISLKAKAWRYHPDDWPLEALCVFELCEKNIIRDTFCVIIIAFCCLLLLPTTVLCSVQSKNYCFNKTTNERLSRKAQNRASPGTDDTSIITEDVTTVRSRPLPENTKCKWFFNCTRMCKRKKVTSQADLLQQYRLEANNETFTEFSGEKESEYSHRDSLASDKERNMVSNLLKLDPSACDPSTAPNKSPLQSVTENQLEISPEHSAVSSLPNQTGPSTGINKSDNFKQKKDANAYDPYEITPQDNKESPRFN